MMPNESMPIAERNKALDLLLSRSRMSVKTSFSQYCLKNTHIHPLVGVGGEHWRADSFRAEKNVRRENENELYETGRTNTHRADCTPVNETWALVMSRLEYQSVFYAPRQGLPMSRQRRDVALLCERQLHRHQSDALYSPGRHVPQTTDEANDGVHFCIPTIQRHVL